MECCYATLHQRCNPLGFYFWFNLKVKINYIYDKEYLCHFYALDTTMSRNLNKDIIATF